MRLARRRFLRETWSQGLAPGHQGFLGTHILHEWGVARGWGSWAQGSNILKAILVFSADEATIKDNLGDTGPLNNPEVPLPSHFPADWPPPWGGAQTGRSWALSTWDPREPPLLLWVLAPQGPPAGCGEAAGQPGDHSPPGPAGQPWATWGRGCSFAEPSQRSVD